MTSTPTLAAIRYGTGLAPGAAPPADAAALLADLDGPDTMAEAYPVTSSAEVWAGARAINEANKARKGGDQAAFAQLQQMRRALNERAMGDLVAILARGIAAPVGFRERLTWFWANHFTVVNKNGALPSGPAAYAEDALRPNLGAPFATMLKAAITHPMMLLYLDQANSAAPDSLAAQRRHAGLNENLGRELMELHSLGVGAPYTQTDVRQMAVLLAGLGYDPARGFLWRQPLASRAAVTVLGKTYPGPGSLDRVHAALDDLAMRPETARHVSTQLATHFIADTPDPKIVAAMVAAWKSSGGSLAKVYAAMLAEPLAWQATPQKVRLPFDYMAAALRALAVPPATLAALPLPRQRGLIYNQLALMGQQPAAAPGPNGWPEAAAAWIQPQTLAARIQWAMTVPGQLQPQLPDPRAFVRTALADAADATTAQAAAQSESRREGVGLVLASTDFNRR